MASRKKQSASRPSKRSDVLSVVISVSKGPGLVAIAGGRKRRQRVCDMGRSAGPHGPPLLRCEATLHGDPHRERRSHRFLEKQKLSTLFVYFAGHGECFGWEKDYWILSNDKPGIGDVIDVAGTVELARRAGVPRVAIFADACRNVFSRIDFGLTRSPARSCDMKNDAVEVTIDRFWRPGQARPLLRYKNVARPRMRTVSSPGF